MFKDKELTNQVNTLVTNLYHVRADVRCVETVVMSMSAIIRKQEDALVKQQETIDMLLKYLNVGNYKGKRMSKTNIEQSYQEWLSSVGRSPSTPKEAFDAGFNAGSLQPPEELTDARLVVLARQEIDIERQKQLLANQSVGIRKAKDTLANALRELEQLKGSGPWGY